MLFSDVLSNCDSDSAALMLSCADFDLYQDDVSILWMQYAVAGLSLRQIASLSGIPHQTIFNWRKGYQPRQHLALYDDLDRLGMILGLYEEDTALLQQLSGCISERSKLFNKKEA